MPLLRNAIIPGMLACALLVVAWAPAGSHAIIRQCDAGKYSNAQTGSCTPCEAGKYAPTPGTRDACSGVSACNPAAHVAVIPAELKTGFTSLLAALKSFDLNADKLGISSNLPSIPFTGLLGRSKMNALLDFEAAAKEQLDDAAEVTFDALANHLEEAFQKLSSASVATARAGLAPLGIKIHAGLLKNADGEEEYRIDFNANAVERWYFSQNGASNGGVWGTEVERRLLGVLKLVPKADALTGVDLSKGISSTSLKVSPEAGGGVNSGGGTLGNVLFQAAANVDVSVGILKGDFDSLVARYTLAADCSVAALPGHHKTSLEEQLRRRLFIRVNKANVGVHASARQLPEIALLAKGAANAGTGVGLSLAGGNVRIDGAWGTSEPHQASLVAVLARTSKPSTGNAAVGATENAWLGTLPWCATANITAALNIDASVQPPPVLKSMFGDSLDNLGVALSLSYPNFVSSAGCPGKIKAGKPVFSVDFDVTNILATLASNIDSQLQQLAQWNPLDQAAESQAADAGGLFRKLSKINFRKFAEEYVELAKAFKAYFAKAASSAAPTLSVLYPDMCEMNGMSVCGDLVDAAVELRTQSQGLESTVVAAAAEIKAQTEFLKSVWNVFDDTRKEFEGLDLDSPSDMWRAMCKYLECPDVPSLELTEDALRSKVLASLGSLFDSNGIPTMAGAIKFVQRRVLSQDAARRWNLLDGLGTFVITENRGGSGSAASAVPENVGMCVALDFNFDGSPAELVATVKKAWGKSQQLQSPPSVVRSALQLDDGESGPGPNLVLPSDGDLEESLSLEAHFKGKLCAAVNPKQAFKVSAAIHNLEVSAELTVNDAKISASGSGVDFRAELNGILSTSVSTSATPTNPLDLTEVFSDAGGSVSERMSKFVSRLKPSVEVVFDAKLLAAGTTSTNAGPMQLASEVIARCELNPSPTCSFSMDAFLTESLRKPLTEAARDLGNVGNLITDSFRKFDESAKAVGGGCK